MEDFTYPRKDYKENGIRVDRLHHLISKHRNGTAQRLKKNLAYYLAEHNILNRSKKDSEAPNNKVVCNHAKDIADTSLGYFLGNAIKYSTSEDKTLKEELDKLTDFFDIANMDEIDHDNGLEIIRLGISYEYVYPMEGTNDLISKNLNPINTFIVYDDTIEQKELFAVYYYKKKNSATDESDYVVTLFDEENKYSFTLYNNQKENTDYLKEDGELHHFKEIPIIEYRNNKDAIGDYEQQIPLIDAYNTIQSDRVNDKEQFLDSLLVVYGALMGEDDKQVSKALRFLRQKGVLEMPDATKAEYITRTFNEEGMEVLRKAIKEDIYTFSHVPNLTDENFVGNSSGVAMEYKLLGLEMITDTKERYYTKGLKKRMRLYASYLRLINIEKNPTAIIPSFTRGLPKNLVEIAQMISNLDGIVSKETLLNQIPFVEDPTKEIEAVKVEKEESSKRQQELFKDDHNTPINKNGLEENEQE